MRKELVTPALRPVSLSLASFSHAEYRNYAHSCEEHSTHPQVFIKYPLTCLKLALGMQGPGMQESFVTSTGVLETDQHMPWVIGSRSAERKPRRAFAM